MAFTFTSFTAGTPILAAAMNGNFTEISSKALDKTTAQTLLATLTAREILPSSADTYNLGGSATRWLTMYGVVGDFSGGATLGGPLTVNGQIAFPSTQNASSVANTLDDYEEGTWTPTLTFGGGSTGMTFTSRTGMYVKVGQLVFTSFSITLSAKGSSTGAAVVGSFPFTSNATTAIYSVVGGYYANMASMSGTIAGFFGPSNTSFGLYTGGAASMAALGEGNFTNTSDIALTLMYRASA